MQRKKTSIFVTVFIIMIISLITLKYVYAKNNDITDKCEMTITNDVKKMDDIQKIKFKVKNNKDVVPGKIAPEMRAIAEIEINLEKTDGFADIEIEFDDLKLNKVFSLNTKFEDECVSTKNTKMVKAGKIEKMLLELIWNGSDAEDTKIGINTASIEIPVKVKVLQHI